MKLCAALAIGLITNSLAAPALELSSRATDPDAGLCTLDPSDDSFWKKNNMEQFITSESHAQSIEAYVTAPNDPKKKQSWFMLLQAQLPKGNKWRCVSGSDSCTDLGLEDSCPTKPRVVAAIKSTLYYRDYLKKTVEQFRNAANEVNGYMAGMQAKYNPSTKSKLPENGLSSLSTTTSIIGAVCGLIPGTGGTLSAALLSVSANAMQMFGDKSETNLELKFDGFTDLTTRLHESIKCITDTFDKKIQDIFTLPPPNTPGPNLGDTTGGGVFAPISTPLQGWNTDPGYAPNVLLDGSFAISQNRDWEKIQTTMKTAFYGQALNYLWRKEGVIVMRVSKKSLSIDPCDPKNPDVYFSRDVKWCDESGNMHVLQARPNIPILQGSAGEKKPTDPKLYKVPGFTDTWKDFNISTKDVMSSSWYFQGKGKRTVEEASQILQDYAKRGDTNGLHFYTLQTCDLDKVPDVSTYDFCNGDAQGMDLAYCQLYNRLDQCRTLDLGTDSDGNKLTWPWPEFEYYWAGEK